MVTLRVAMFVSSLALGAGITQAQPVRGAPWISAELYADLAKRTAASARLRISPLAGDTVVVNRGAISADTLLGFVQERHFTGRTVERQVTFALVEVSRIEDQVREWRRGTVIGLVTGVVASAVVVELVRQSDVISQLDGRTAGEVNALRFGVILGGAAAGAGIGYLTKSWRVLYQRP